VVGGGSTSRTCYVWDGTSILLSFLCIDFGKYFDEALCQDFTRGFIVIEKIIPLQISISWLLKFNSFIFY